MRQDAGLSILLNLKTWQGTKVYSNITEEVANIKKWINFFIYNKLYKQEKNAVTKQKSQYLFCYMASVSAQMKVEQLAIH